MLNQEFTTIDMSVLGFDRVVTAQLSSFVILKQMKRNLLELFLHHYWNGL